MLQRIREARENESGFTLIELLIVIIVLGILAAIVLFGVGTFKSDSQSAACKADKRNIQTASTAYFAKNSAYTDVAGLVSGGYLQTTPTSSTFTIDASGNVTATGC